MLKFIKIITLFFRYLTLAITTILSFCTQDTFKTIPQNKFLHVCQTWFYFIYNNRLLIIIILVTIYVSCELITFIVSENDKKRRIKRLLKIAMDSCFSGDFTSFRITLYIKKNYFTAIIRFLRHSICNLNCHRHWRLYHWKQIPRNPFGKYLVFYARSGKPNSNGTSTIFRLIQENNNKKKTNGIVEECAYEEKEIVVHDLPNLRFDEIEDYNTIKDISNKILKQKVSEYMRKGFVSSFHKLKCIHRYPNQLFAIPVTSERKNHEICGVLVVDSISAQNIETNRNQLTLINKILTTEV
ncbi:MAG: hypothetical protein ABFD79_03685 [Phycisphaerales bacterium]